MYNERLVIKSKSVYRFSFLLILLIFSKQEAVSQPYPPVQEVAMQFKILLQRPVTDARPFFQAENTDSVLVERGYFYSEENEKVPVLIYKPVLGKQASYPAVICLHGTGGGKDNQDIRALLYRLTKSGIMGVAIDARYHGERVKGSDTRSPYVQAITRAWKNEDANGQEHPFFFDTVFDLWKLTDYLISRPDVQAKRIGMTGFSMGGIETWMAASVDSRIRVAVPIIAVQSFRWSLENDRWQGRAKTIWAAHEQVANDLGDSVVNRENVLKLWNKVIPGITGKFDCPSMIRLFAPRPLLILNNENDQNCPLPGARLAFDEASKAYKAVNALEKLKIHVTPHEPHRVTSEHIDMAVSWFSKWL